MKAIITIIIVMLAFSVSSCSGEEEEVETGCHDFCVDSEEAFRFLGMVPVPDCDVPPWTAARTCEACLDIFYDMGISPVDPDGICDEYF